MRVNTWRALKSPLCSCVSITLRASIRTDPETFSAFLSHVVKKERERHSPRPPALRLLNHNNYGAALTRGSPGSLIVKQAMNGPYTRGMVKHENPEKFKAFVDAAES
jgi:hypothetical protein